MSQTSNFFTKSNTLQQEETLSKIADTTTEYSTEMPSKKLLLSQEEQNVLLIERNEGIMTLRFNRPHVLNALDEALSRSLLAAVQTAEFDTSVRCVVLTGNGPGFMSGGDIQLFGETLSRSKEDRKARFHTFIQHVHPTILSLRRMPKPVIASVNGAVAGYGLSLMMACDLSIASDQSSFCMAYGRMGLSPDGGATYSLPRLIGRQKAMVLALLGEALSPDEALSYGLVTKLVPHQDLASETGAMALSLAQGPTYAYGQTKMLINQSCENTLSQQLYQEENVFADCTASQDFTEAATAFLQKRKPNFQGK